MGKLGATPKEKIATKAGKGKKAHPPTAFSQIAEALGYKQEWNKRSDQLTLIVNEIRRLKSLSYAWASVYAGVEEYLYDRMPVNINGAVANIIELYKELHALRQFKNNVRNALNVTYTENEKLLERIQSLKESAELYDEIENEDDDEVPYVFPAVLRSVLNLRDDASNDRVIRHIRFKVGQLHKYRTSLMRLANLLDTGPDLSAMFRVVQGLKNRDALRRRFFSEIKELG